MLIFWAEMRVDLIFYIIALFSFCFPVWGQWNDHFETFDTSVWKGDVTDFKVNTNQELMLEAQAAGKSSIARSFDIQDTLEVSFFASLQFAPSAANLLRIYLNADQQDLSIASGYFIEIGENGSQDKWKLFRRLNGKNNLVTEGVTGKLAVDPAVIRMKIRKEGNNLLNVLTDYTGGKNFISEKIVPDTGSLSPNRVWFGIECVYTETRKDKFSFDDIMTSMVNPDREGPKLIFAEAINSHEVKLSFDEPIDTFWANNTALYVISALGPPDDLDILNEHELSIHFQSAFVSQTNYEINCSQIKDKTGNSSSNLRQSFLYVQENKPTINQVLITEFMADPSPSIALPEKEYIELTNVSNQVLQLKNCTLTDGTGKAVIPEFYIQPGEIIICCSKSDSVEFQKFGRVLGLNNFPSLNNSGDHIFLLDDQGMILHDVSYTDDWYQSEEKKEGGYSLEMKNPYQLCHRISNWSASTHPAGGTPGRQNQGWNTIQDVEGPQLLSAYVISEWEIKLIFDEALDEFISTDPGIYNITPSRSIATADLLLVDQNEITLLLHEKLEPGIEYKIDINGLADCVGNVSSHISHQPISLPSIPMQGDLIWNEILFNPATGGADYVEIFNRSNKQISLQNLFVVNFSQDSNWVPIKSEKIISGESFIVFTTNPMVVNQQYSVCKDSLLILKNNLPSLPDDAGRLALGYLNKQGKMIILDSMTYDASWHHPFLSSKEGVSLERIQSSGLSSLRSNWQSATSSCSFGTPGLQNSQHLNPVENPVNEFYSIKDRVITPDGNGHRDFLDVFFQLKNSGYKLQADIYDLSGNLRRHLYNQILASEEHLLWYGDDDDGNPVQAGNYILSLYLYTPDGNKHHFKERIVVDYK